MSSSGKETREALLESASMLLVTRGLCALTVQSVAERSSAEPESIYRWWPSEEALAMDALRCEWIALARREGGAAALTSPSFAAGRRECPCCLGRWPATLTAGSG
jgi:AcrR family transcriptional regulator